MPRTVDHAQRRREIAYAVWALVAARGIEAVTLRNVAAEAGISVGRIQHYFPTREEMVRFGCRAMVDEAHAAFAADTADRPPRAVLRALLVHAVPATDRLRTGTAVWYAYLAKSVDDPEIAALLARTQQGLEDEATRLLEAVGDGDARRTARRLLALADGLAVRVLVGHLGAADAVAVVDDALAALPRAAHRRRATVTSAR